MYSCVHYECINSLVIQRRNGRDDLLIYEKYGLADHYHVVNRFVVEPIHELVLHELSYQKSLINLLCLPIDPPPGPDGPRVPAPTGRFSPGYPDDLQKCYTVQMDRD